MFEKLRENADTLILVAAVAGGVWFVDSLDQRVTDMQALDERWFDTDAEQTADILAAIEEVRTAQGVMLGRLDVVGGELLYRVGYRDGRAAACREWSEP